jgi:benzoate membrane transport protein
MLKNLEKGGGFRKGVSGIPSRINGDNVSAGIVAGIFNIGTLLLITKILRDAGLQEDVVLSWILVVFTGGGLLSVGMALYYQKPIAGAWSIAGLVLVGGALPFYPLPQVTGGFLMAGMIVAVLGFSGVIGQIVRWLPRPVMMAMIAGILLRFGIGIVTSLEQAPFLAGATFLLFVFSQRFSRVFRLF